MGWSLGRALAVGILGIVLLVSLLGANLVVGVDRTALDSEFVKDSLEEEEAYAVILAELQDEVVDETGEPTDEPAPEEILADVVTEEYIQEQTEANIDRLYAFLHGERDELYLAVETEPLKDDLAAEIAQSVIEEQDIEEFDPRFAAMTESEAEFEAAREEFKEEQKQRIQDETQPELTEEELEEAYEESREEIREEAIAELEADVQGEEFPSEAEDAAIELGTVYIDGLTEPELTYAEFMERVEDAEESFVEAAESAARTQLDEELPDTLELTDELSEEDQEELALLQEWVSLVSTLSLAIPAIALVVSVLIGWLTATRSAGLIVVGASSAIAGAATLGGFTVLQGTVATEIRSEAAQGEIPPELAELAVGLLDRILGVFIGQSWVLVGLGALLVVGGFAIRWELLPVDDHPGEDPEEEASDRIDEEIETDEPVEPEAEIGETVEADETTEPDETDETDEEAEPDEVEAGGSESGTVIDSKTEEDGIDDSEEKSDP